MNATLTLDLDSEVLAGAEQEARRRNTTIADVVARQLRVMALNWQVSQAGKTPVTDALRGVISLPGDFDERREIIEALTRKHGS